LMESNVVPGQHHLLWDEPKTAPKADGATARRSASRLPWRRSNAAAPTRFCGDLFSWRHEDEHQRPNERL
jgi:hypothetical protein